MIYKEGHVLWTDDMSVRDILIRVANVVYFRDSPKGVESFKETTGLIGISIYDGETRKHRYGFEVIDEKRFLVFLLKG